MCIEFWISWCIYMLAVLCLFSFSLCAMLSCVSKSSQRSRAALAQGCRQNVECALQSMYDAVWETSTALLILK